MRLAAFALGALCALGRATDPTSVSFFPGTQSHSTTILTDNSSIICSATAVDGACNLLTVSPNKQALSGPSFVLSPGQPFFSIALSRVDSTHALVCFTTNSTGMCSVLTSGACGPPPRRLTPPPPRALRDRRLRPERVAGSTVLRHGRVL
jgi:hypothetical protein